MVTQEQQSIIDHAQLQKINGWQHIKVKGTPYECGFQEGYLLADEYQDALRVYKFMTLETFGMTYEWFAEQALKLHRDKIPTRWLEELRGMAEGLTAAGIPTTTDDMIAWNDWMEITGYWWPQNAGKVMSRPLMKTHRKEHCSAIVATGSATVDGKPYLGSRTRWPRALRATACSLRSTARACCSWAKAASAKARPQPSCSSAATA